MSSDKEITPDEEKEEALFSEYLEEGEYDYQEPKRGEIRDGIILRKDADQIIVDIGAKREGIVPASDLEKLGPDAVAELQVGDHVPVYVLRPESHDGDIIVSINMARQMADWDQAEKLMQADEILEREVVGYNKGGLLVQVGGLQGFVPRSHIVDLNGRTTSGTPQERLSQMIGRQLPLKIIEVNRRQRRLILSERAAWREWRAEQKKRLLEDLEVGDVRKGTVTSLADFGAFVDLGGADGLIHLSELSWDRGKKPSDVLQVGDEVEVKIISLDRERKRIGLSLKQLKPNPWETIEERYAIGQYVDVEITNLAKFGAFARLEEGIEGLIHISELADHNVQHPSEVVEPGQVVTVQILGLDPQRKRVALSIRRVPEHLRTPVESEEEAETLEEAQAPAEVAAELVESVVEPAEEATLEEPEPAEEVTVEPTESAESVAQEEVEQVPEPATPESVPAESTGPAETPADQAEEAAIPEPQAEEGAAPEPPVTTDTSEEDQPIEEPVQQPFDSAQDSVLPDPEASPPDNVPVPAGMNGDNVAQEEAEAIPTAESSEEPQVAQPRSAVSEEDL